MEILIRRLLTTFIVLISVVFAASCSTDNRDNGAMPPPVVSVKSFEITDIDYFRDYPARVHGEREVEVRARVEGILSKRLYKEGVEVSSGQSLFIIDQEPYRIALKKAVAQHENARAELNQAQRDWKRITSLYERGVVSDQDRDRSLTQLELARAQLALSEAAVAEAELHLQYTEVKAPIAGITGLEAYNEGNLISHGTLLTTITQLDPVHVRFSIPERDSKYFYKPAAMIIQESIDYPLRSISIILSDGSTYPIEGILDFTASTIDPATGTLNARGVFSNPKGKLVPGQFLRVKVKLRKFEDILLIPQEAVGQGRNGPQVFVVGDEEIAKARPVKLGPVIDGEQVITDGISPVDRVIVNGQVRVRDGIQVSIAETDNGE